jgi:hypothetical protein
MRCGATTQARENTAGHPARSIPGLARSGQTGSDQGNRINHREEAANRTPGRWLVVDDETLACGGRMIDPWI